MNDQPEGFCYECNAFVSGRRACKFFVLDNGLRIENVGQILCTICDEVMSVEHKDTSTIREALERYNAGGV